MGIQHRTTKFAASACIYRFFFLMVCFCCLSTQAIAASLVAEVNREEVAVGESFTLIVVADGVTGQPELAPLRVDFEVLRTSTRREVQITDGVMLDLQTWDIELMPLRTGRLEIPVLTLKGVASQPLSINVVEQTAVQAGSDERDLFIEVNIDEPSPFVQAQAIYKIRFFSALRVSEAELSEPESDKLTVRRLGEDTGFFQQRGGKRYRVIERSYAVFPQESGTIVIPPATLQLSVPDGDDPTGGFFGRVKRVTLRSPPVELNVRAKPPVPDNFDAGSSWWLPARSMGVRAAWEGNPTEFRVGEPVTRVITLDADGVVGEQLPEIDVATISTTKDALRIYSDKPEVVEQPLDASLSAKRIEKWAVIPQSEGEVELPAVEVTWFDTVAEVYRVATVPAETLTVLPAIGTAAQQPVVPESANNAAQDQLQADALTAGSNTETDVNSAAGAGSENALESGNSGDSTSLVFWKRLAAAAMAAWLLTSVAALTLWWRMRRKSVQNPNKAESDKKLLASKRRAMKQVRKHTAESATPAVIAASVLHWASTHWPGQPPRSLQALAEQYPPEASDTRKALLRLDESAFGTDGSNSHDIWKNLPELLTTHLPEPTDKNRTPINWQQGDTPARRFNPLSANRPGDSARELPGL